MIFVLVCKHPQNVIFSAKSYFLTCERKNNTFFGVASGKKNFFDIQNLNLLNLSKQIKTWKQVKKHVKKTGFFKQVFCILDIKHYKK